MGTVFKNLSLFSPSTASFEDTYKTAYSHGLEEIYALENVDISSIKPIKFEEKKEKKIKRKATLANNESQLYFEFGGEFRLTIESFTLSEPIHVLNLSKPLEKNLIEQGLLSLRALIEKDLSELIFIKGFGQGHIDEIGLKLANYVQGRELYKKDTIDFASLIKCLAASIDRKLVKEGLKDFDLDELIELSPVEGMEIRRLTLEKRNDLKKKFLSELKLKTEMLEKMMGDIIDVFIKPWLRNRHGLATRAELYERLQRMSDDPEVSTHTLKLIQTLDTNFLVPHIFQIEEELYCVDEMSCKGFFKVIDKAQTYFYKPYLSYDLSELILWIEREFARDWEGYSEGFIEKALRLSPRFRVRKGEEGVLVIRLA